jgi:TolB-like protein/tetratricopeptide (TPR) repeat protein
VIGWVLAQIAEFAFENFGAPDWVLKSFVVLLLLGLPIVLIFAWAFEMTPDGLKRERDVDRSASITPQTGRKLDRLIIGVLIVALGYFAFDKFAGPNATTDSASVAAENHSIAVLPFANMSDDSDHFADGLTEELLNLLAQNRDLKVAGRTSSFAFKGRNEDLRAIGDALGVTKVLEGSVRRSNDRIRITAQLINVDDGFHIWSDTYDRQLEDIFDIQDQVAGAITQALQLHLTPVADRITESSEAYALYLEAVALSSINQVDDIRNALALLDRATGIDPSFAKAYEQKAFFHWMSAGWIVDAEVGQRAVHAAALRALELDPTLSSANSLAATSSPTNWSWIVEIEALEKLVQNDRSVRALDTYGYDLNASGYASDAVAVYLEVVAVDPLSSNAWWRMGDAKASAGNRDAAVDAWEKSSRLGDKVVSKWRLSTLMLMEGEDQRAAEILDSIPGYFADFYPDATTFIAAMRDPEHGRANLQTWIEARASMGVDIVDRIAPYANYLSFGHLDLFIESVERFNPSIDKWSNGEELDLEGFIFRDSGYMATEFFIKRAKATGLTALWDHRGAPDHCSKQSGEWVCQ